MPLSGRVARGSTRLRDGDRVELTVSAPEAMSAAPESIPLRIVYEAA